jgi:hypothetical protein
VWKFFFSFYYLLLLLVIFISSLILVCIIMILILYYLIIMIIIYSFKVCFWPLFGNLLILYDFLNQHSLYNLNFKNYLNTTISNYYYIYILNKIFGINLCFCFIFKTYILVVFQICNFYNSPYNQYHKLYVFPLLYIIYYIFWYKIIN